jgi:hypothetical protein
VVDVLHSPPIVVQLHGEGGHVADGVHAWNACFEEPIGLDSTFLLGKLALEETRQWPAADTHDDNVSFEHSSVLQLDCSNLYR